MTIEEAKGIANKEIYKRAVSREPREVAKLETRVPVPTTDDYANGFITRYFARQANSPNSSIIEIDKKQFSKTRGDKTYFYTLISLDWKISGDLNSKIINGIKHIGILEANQNSINEAEKELSNISTVLNNLVQFYTSSGKVTTTSEGGGNTMNGEISSGGATVGGGGY